MKIPQATEKPVKKVLSLLARTVARISCHLSRSNTARLSISKGA
jgi:hypothetical protein